MDIPDKTMNAIEADLVDKYGMKATLFALSIIAREKAEHIQETYSDRALAKAWGNDAAKILRCAASLKGAW